MKAQTKAMAVVALTCVLAAGMGGAGCRGDNGEAPTTRGTLPPVAGVEVNAPLVVKLLAPAEVRVGNGPSTQPARPVTIKLMLVVTNTTADRVYRGEAPNAAVARFALECDGQPIWSNSEFSAQVITPVAIGPGGRMTYQASARLADIRPYVGKTLTAHASFTPAALTADASVPVR